MAENKVEVGRVIFAASQYPGQWVVQTLDNHVNNVVQLARAWDHTHALLAQGPNLEAVIAAAEIHDMAKPQKFWLGYNFPQTKAPPKREWLYSFSGHRFAVEHPDPYVKALALLHHTYSVDEITTQMAKLEGSDSRVKNLPIDLYVLEMCDQIEATISSAFLGDKEPEARVFMDFQFHCRKDTERKAAEYEIDPFVFKNEPMRLTIAFAAVTPPAALKDEVEKATTEDTRNAYLRKLRSWLLERINQPDTIQTAEVTIWPWT